MVKLITPLYLLALAERGVVQAGKGEVEIEFEPMEIDDAGPPGELMAMLGGGSERRGPPGELMAMLGGGGGGGGFAAGPQGVMQVPGGFMVQGSPHRRGGGDHHREAQLDDMLSSMFGGMIAAPPHQRRHQSAGPFGGGAGPFSAGPFGGGEVIVEDLSGGGPQIEIMGPRVRGNSLPAGLLRDLFPGPASMEEATERHQPFGQPDPLITDLMQGLDRAFASELLPAAQRLSAADRAPRACEQDVKDKCATSRSQLHCLGQHSESISQACRHDVGKSVPFLCHRQIDRWCDLLETGLLDCLDGHLKELDEQCRDAVVTTRHVIDKANTHKASLVDPKTGGKKVSKPAPKSLAKRKVAAGSVTSGHGRLIAMVLTLALVAGIGYVIAFTNIPKRIQAELAYRLKALSLGTVEGKKLLGGVELPKPNEM